MNRIIPQCVLPCVGGHRDDTPDFNALLQDLERRHLTSTGVSRPKQQELEQAQLRLAKERERYMSLSLVYNALRETLDDTEAGAGSPIVNEGVELARARLRLAQSRRGLQFPSEALEPNGNDLETQLFGLSAEDMEAACQVDATQVTAHTSLIQQALLPRLEDSLRSKCEQVAEYHDPRRSAMKRKFGCVSQVSIAVADERAAIDSNMAQLIEQRVANTAAFWEYHSMLLRTLTVLHTVLTQHKLDARVKSDAVQKDWLVAQCRTLCLKLALLKNQVRSDTYTVEAIAALRVIGKAVDAALTEAVADHDKAAAQLKQYRELGPEFKEKADEYGSLLSRLREQRWALEKVAD